MKNPTFINLAFWIVLAIILVVIFNVWPSLQSSPTWIDFLLVILVGGAIGFLLRKHGWLGK